MAAYLNSYVPLVATRIGLEASRQFNLPPFIDGSIRREPDLEHQLPTITCLCRAGNFAPRLKVGDAVVYMTRKGRYGEGPVHRRLTAALRVRHLLNSHEEAASWFALQRMALPNNCMVPGNAAFPVAHSHRIHTDRRETDARLQRMWDAGYGARARAHGRVVVCDPLWVNVTWTAPEMHDSDLLEVFGRIPGTRNPGQLTPEELQPLLDRMRAPVRLSSR